MRIFQRLTDIVSANLDELIDRYEDPELLLKQAVREMEESIRSAMEDAAQVVADEKILARQLTEEDAATAAWQRRAQAAVARGDDAAAREALRSKRDREAASAALAIQLQEATKASQALRRQLEAMRAKLSAAQRKLTLLAARQRAAKARQRLIRSFGSVSFNDAGFQKFERMCRRVERSEAEAEALAELTGDRLTCDRLSPFDEDPAAGDAIEAELQELKAACGA
jgi:phage shock protein A